MKTQQRNRKKTAKKKAEFKRKMQKERLRVTKGERKW